MADKRIDAHTNTTTVADVDEFIVDSGSNGTRNITYSNLKDQLLGTTSIATIGNSVTEAIYNVHMDQAVPKIDTTTGVMYLEGGAAFEGNIDSTPTAGSNNAVSSGGTKTYVDNAVSQLNDEIDAITNLIDIQGVTVAYPSSGTPIEKAQAIATAVYNNLNIKRPFTIVNINSDGVYRAEMLISAVTASFKYSQAIFMGYYTDKIYRIENSNGTITIKQLAEV